MAGRVLSMEIGQGTTRVVEMDYMAKTPKIYNAFTLETPKDMVQDGVLARNEEFLIDLKTEIRRREIKTDSVVFTVTSSRIANREAKIPLCKENKILPLITANAADYFPVDMNQYHLVYNILGTTEEKDEKQYRLSLLAVPNDVTTSYLDLAHSLGMHIKAMDYVGNSIYQATRSSLGSGVNAVIKVDEYSSLITIVRDGEIVLQRAIAHGVNAAIENMMELDLYGENMTYSDATQAFLHNRCLRRYLNVDVDYQEQEDTTDEMMMSRIMLTENLRYLIGNIGRILEYYVSRNDNVQIEQISLVGLGADFLGLDELLTNELGYNVKAYAGEETLSVLNKKFFHDISKRQFIACLGATVKPLQLLSPELMKSEKQISLVIPFSIMVAGIVIALALFMVSQILLASENSKKDAAQKRIRDNQYIIQIRNNYDTTMEAYNYVWTYNDIATNNNSQLLSLISELERNMPTTFNTLGLSATEEGVTFAVTCDTKEAAADIIYNIRTRVHTIEVIASSGFTETQEDMNLANPVFDEEGKLLGYEDEDGNVVEIDVESPDYEPDLKTTISFTLQCYWADVKAN